MCSIVRCGTKMYMIDTIAISIPQNGQMSMHWISLLLLVSLFTKPKADISNLSLDNKLDTMNLTTMFVGVLILYTICRHQCDILMHVGGWYVPQVYSGESSFSRARFLSLTRSKLRLCSANHRAGYFSNLACDWLSIVWAYSKQETENGPSQHNVSWFHNHMD